ncbi:MAG TPA: FHA domain-containing protein [Kofleriaceae bacterium]|nr:FHA domain-containing protein [Kofleriaceae bacterium]
MELEPHAVLVWSGTKPRREIFPIPPSGLVVGRDLFETDDERISRQHTRITPVPNGYRLEDLKTRHGTFVEGNAPLHEPFVVTKSPRFFRAARSVFILTRDVEAHGVLIDLPPSLLRMVRARSTQGQLHASAVIDSLVEARRSGLEHVLDMFARSVAAWIPRGRSLRADELWLTSPPSAAPGSKIRAFPTREDRATCMLLDKLEKEMGITLGGEMRPHGQGFVWGDQGDKGKRRFEVDCTWGNTGASEGPAYNIHLFDGKQELPRSTLRKLDDAVAIVKAWIADGRLLQ